MRLQGNLVPSPNSTVPPPARPSYQPSLKMTCTNVPAAARGCSDRSTRRCTVVHFHSRCRNRSESNEATVLEITAGAGIWEHVESGHAAAASGGSAASSPGGSRGNRCMKARNLACRMASGFVSGLVVAPERILQLLLLPVSRLQYEPLPTAEILPQHPEQRGSWGCWQQRKQYDPVGTG